MTERCAPAPSLASFRVVLIAPSSAYSIDVVVAAVTAVTVMVLPVSTTMPRRAECIVVFISVTVRTPPSSCHPSISRFVMSATTMRAGMTHVKVMMHVRMVMSGSIPMMPLRRVVMGPVSPQVVLPCLRVEVDLL